MKKEGSTDWKLMIAIYILVVIGILMVYSASSIWASYKFDDAFYFGKRQFLFAVVGLIAMII